MTDDHILEPLPSGAGGISLSGVLIGFIIGLGLGLFYTWQIDPVVVRNTAPADLRPEDKQLYIIAAAREYNASGDLQRAVTRLLEVEPAQNPFELAADTACQLIRSGQVNDLDAIEVVRNLRAIYEPQGYLATCDTTFANTPVPVTIIVPTPTATYTPSITPVATKTPTAPVESAPLNTPIPRSTSLAPQTDTTFREAFVEPFCDAAISGIIEIYVRDVDSLGLPGVAVEVSWGTRQSQTFYTGLKPERGDDYADFKMEANETYRVRVLNGGQISRELIPTPCDAVGTLTSYRVVLQRFPNN